MHTADFPIVTFTPCACKTTSKYSINQQCRLDII